MSKDPRMPTAAKAPMSWNKPGEAKITRALNIDLPESDIIAKCRSKAIAISATESLLSGGTHLVCVTIEGADEARIVFKQAIIPGPVRRASFQRIEAARYR